MRKILTVAFTTVLLVLGAAGVASAHHAPPVLHEPDVIGECGKTVLLATLPAEQHGSYAGTLLVASAGGQVHTAGLGEPLELGPFDDVTEISYRVFGGGERAYDLPTWAGYQPGASEWRDGLVGYIGEHGDDWTTGDADDPYTTWLTLEVDGCPPASDDEDQGEDDDTAAGEDEADDEIGDAATPAPVPTAIPAGLGTAASGPGTIGTLLTLLGAFVVVALGGTGWLIRQNSRGRGRYRAVVPE